MEGFNQCPGCTRKLARRFAACPYCSTAIPGGGVPSEPSIPVAPAHAAPVGAHVDGGPFAAPPPTPNPDYDVAAIAGAASAEAMGVGAPLTLVEKLLLGALGLGVALAMIGVWFWMVRVCLGDGPGRLAMVGAFAIGLAANAAFFVGMRARASSILAGSSTAKVGKAFGISLVLFFMGYLGGSLALYGLLHAVNAVTLEDVEASCVVVRTWSKSRRGGGAYREMQYRCDEPAVEGTTTLSFEEGNKDGNARAFRIDARRGLLGWWWAPATQHELTVKQWEYKGREGGS